MTVKVVIPRTLALRDVDEAVDHYLGAGAEKAALGFVNALEKTYLHIGRQPAFGSSRDAHTLNLPGLRSWPLARDPYLVFYFELAAYIDVWRVLHGQRDIPAWMDAP